MKNRTYLQYQGFVNTPSIFLDSSFLGLAVFNWNLINLDISFPSSNAEEFPSKLALGKRVEYFFKGIAENTDNYQLLGNNIQIHNKTRTLGEFDFILKDLETSQILHIELMYKFYVYDPEIPSEMARWIGPNRKDSLLQKIEKVKTHQFPLLHTPEAKEVLKSFAIDSKPIQQQICFKATLFIPEKMKEHKFPEINKECIAGFYYHLKELTKFDQSEFEFFAPEKQDWPIAPKHGELWVNYKEIFQQIQELHSKKKSPLIWIKKSGGVFEKIMVVWW